MTEPDYRALCAELVDDLEMSDWPSKLKEAFRADIARARALLDQPEPEGPGDDETSNNGYEALCRQLIRDLAAARDALEAWTEYFTENEQPTAKSFCMKEYKSARDAYSNACTAMAVLRRPAL